MTWNGKKWSLVAIAAVVLTGVILFVMPRGKQDEEVVTEPETKAKRAKRVTPPKAVSVSKPKAVATNRVEKLPPKRPVTAWRNPKLPEEKRLDAYEKKLAESPLPNTSSNRLFRSGLEQVMGWVFTTEVGDMPPPLPRVPDFDIVHLKEILDAKCEVNEGDTEKQIDAKTTVEFAKEELRNYLEKGGTPDEFLTYYHDKLKTAFQHRQMVQTQVMKVAMEEPEIAEDFLKEANAGLAKQGIKAVVIPDRIRRRIGLPTQEDNNSNRKVTQ